MLQADGRLDPPEIPFESQPGAFEQRFSRYELWPGYNESCVWQVKSGAVEPLTFGQVFRTTAEARAAVEELGLVWSTVLQMTAMDAVAAFTAAMGGYTQKQRADWYLRVTDFLGSVYEPADEYVPPASGPSAIRLTQPGTLVVRGPFAAPRHIVHLSVETPDVRYRPFTIDVLIGCNAEGLSPAATVRLKLEVGPTISAVQPLTSHVLTGDSSGWAECGLVMQLLDAAGSVVDSVTIAHFPHPFFAGDATNNACRLGLPFPLRLAISSDGPLRIEAIFSHIEHIADGLDTGSAAGGVSPPLRHLLPQLPGYFDVSRIAVRLASASNNSVSVVHRPLGQNANGTPEWFGVQQGAGCQGSGEAEMATAAGTKTNCTSWSRSCHVTHSQTENCLQELDVDLAGTFIPQAHVSPINNADVAAVLQGAFTLGRTSAGSASLWQNSFWFEDDEDLAVGVATRKRLEISGVIGAHWPVPVCVGSERPVEIAFFCRAIIRVSSNFVLPFPFGANTDYPIHAVLRCNVSQRIFQGERVSASNDSMSWDLDFPWGASFWDKAGKQLNTLLLGLSKCEFQLR
jgi:hypothetical protein